MRAWTGLALAAAGIAALAVVSPPARGQDAGDRVVVTLTSGKQFSGTLVSRDDTGVTLRIGDSPISLPASMVSGVAKDTPRKAPAPKPAPAAGGSPAPAEGTPVGADDGPRPATVLLKDGTMVEGFLLKKGDGRIWIVPGRAVAVSEGEVDEVFGDFLEAGGLTISGDAAKDSLKLVQELGSSDIVRVKGASAALEAYGEQALPALIKGLKSEKRQVRNMCLGMLAARQVVAALDGIVAMMRSDPELGLRASAAEALVGFNQPAVRRALLETAWRDKDDRVKASAVRSLQRLATVEEVPALIDLINILPPDSDARKGVFEALRRATGLRLASEGTLWTEWWDSGGGRETIGEQIQAAIQKRFAEEARQAQGR